MSSTVDWLSLKPGMFFYRRPRFSTTRLRPIYGFVSHTAGNPTGAWRIFRVCEEKHVVAEAGHVHFNHEAEHGVPFQLEAPVPIAAEDLIDAASLPAVLHMRRAEINRLLAEKESGDE